MTVIKENLTIDTEDRSKKHFVGIHKVSFEIDGIIYPQVIHKVTF